MLYSKGLRPHAAGPKDLCWLVPWELWVAPRELFGISWSSCPYFLVSSFLFFLVSSFPPFLVSLSPRFPVFYFYCFSCFLLASRFCFSMLTRAALSSVLLCGFVVFSFLVSFSPCFIDFSFPVFPE